MTRKMLVLDACEHCPHFDVDPNDVDTPPERWGVPSCRHPDVGYCAVMDWRFDIPSWCPLPDAAT